ncbi:unnamed protein product, partial [Didymodactylos carnosus]
CVPIPVEIIRGSGSTTSRPSLPYQLDSPFRTTPQNANFISNHSPFFHTTTTMPYINNNHNSSYESRGIHTHQGPKTAFDRLINDSTFYQPPSGNPSFYRQSLQTQYPRNSQYISTASNLNEPTITSFRSSKDLSDQYYSLPDSILLEHANGNDYGYLRRPNFDNRYFQQNPTSRRSYDVLNDYSDKNFRNFPRVWSGSTFTTGHPNEQDVAVDAKQLSQKYDTYNIPYQSIFPGQTDGTSNAEHDPSRSPASNRRTSPGAPQREQQFQQSTDGQKSTPVSTNNPVAPEQTESNLPTAPIPMSCNQEQTQQDQQVPSTGSPVQSQPLQRDANQIAIEKLENIKTNLADLSKRVDEFKGTTRDERLYKELDEQAVKLMIRCDELVNVRDEIKEKRKEMIQNVQHVLTKLELKIPTYNNDNQTRDTALVVYSSQLDTLNKNNSSIDESLSSTTETRLQQKPVDATAVTTIVAEQQLETSS